MDEATANLRPVPTAQSFSMRAPASFAEYDATQGNLSGCNISLLAPPGSS